MSHPMLAPPDHFAIRPFSNAMVPDTQSFPAWSRLLNKWLIQAETTSLSKDIFPISVRLRVLPEIRYGWGTVGASHYDRPRTTVAQENDDVMLFVNLGGTCIGRSAGREAALRPGEAYLMSCSEPGSYTQPEGGHMLCLRVRRNALQPLTRNLDDKLGAVIAGDVESLRLLSTYLRTVGDTEPLADDGVRSLATRYVHELLALSLGAATDVPEAARDGGLRAARLKAAKAIIRRSLLDTQLCPEFVAGQLQLSPRSLQRLFESDGSTFSSFVSTERLGKAYAALADVRNVGRKVTDIAFDCGFADISYFNRQFRERYRATPLEIRHRELIEKKNCK